MNNYRIIIIYSFLLCLLAMMSGCVKCLPYNLGRSAEMEELNEGTSASTRIEEIIGNEDRFQGNIGKDGCQIVEIFNLEQVDMVVSYFPMAQDAQPIENILIPAGKLSSKFAGATLPGRISIKPDERFFTAPGDGANIDVCFSCL